MHNVLNILASFAAIHVARLNVEEFIYHLRVTSEPSSALRFKIMG